MINLKKIVKINIKTTEYKNGQKIKIVSLKIFGLTVSSKTYSYRVRRNILKGNTIFNY